MRSLRLLAMIVVGAAGIGSPVPASDGAEAAQVRIVAFDIDVTIDPESRSLSERTRILIEGTGASRVEFEINEGLSLERTETSEGTIEGRKRGRSISVDLSPKLDGRRTITMTLSGRPTVGTGMADRIGDRVALLDGRDAWYPIRPGSWAPAAVAVRVPAGWTAVASGRPVGDGAEGVWRWTADRPVRTVAIAAAPGLRLTDAPLGTSTLRVAAPPGGPDAARLVDALFGPMSWLSGALAPYPFEEFHLVLLPEGAPRIRGSGILAVDARLAPADASDGAALLTGQWFGERVAGDGRWIDALAAWQAVVFTRDRGRAMPAEIRRLREEYLRLPASADVAIARADRSTPDAIVRGKGSAVPDMIRLAVPDRDFQATIRDLFAEPEGAPLELSSWRAALEIRSDRTLLRSFSDWFERTGLPRLEASLRTRPASTGGWRADVEIRQSGGLYALPVEVLLVGPNDRRRERIEIEGERTTVFRILEFEPARIELDPSGILFRYGGTEAIDR